MNNLLLIHTQPLLMTVTLPADEPTARGDCTLTVGAGAGLTARLRILISGMALAEMTQRRFRMLWPLTSHCSAPFEALFVNAWNVETLDESQAAELRRLPRFTPNELPLLLSANERDLARRHMSWHEPPVSG